MRSSVLGVGETRQYVDRMFTAWVTCLGDNLYHVVVRGYGASRQGKIVYNKHLGSYVQAVKAVARYCRTGVSSKFIVAELPLIDGAVGDEGAAAHTAGSGL